MQNGRVMAEDGFHTAAALWSGSALLVEDGRCVNVRGRSEICARCVKACPKDALELGLDGVTVSDDCSDCGACLPACPAAALKLGGFSPVALLQAVEGCTEIHLHCRESAGGDGGVVIPCHQVLDARLLAAMSGAGCGEIAIHGLEKCKTCRHGTARKHLERVQRTLTRWLGEDAPVLTLSPEAVEAIPAQKPDRHDQIRVDRRSFFRLAGSQAASVASSWVAPVEEEAPDPFAAFNSTLTPAAPDPYQTALAIKVDDIAWKKKSLPIFWREFSDACTLCMACADRCPTGALAPLAGNLARGIGFSSLLCTNCGLCTQVCPFEAVNSGAVRDPDYIGKAPVVLKQLHLQQCPQCLAEFAPVAPGQTLCLTCSNEQEIEDEWLSFMEE
jgi:NAD-dependent dihydropyrimidine dehydrogenase PreA subunit